jgi:hypothetical protein
MQVPAVVGSRARAHVASRKKASGTEVVPPNTAFYDFNAVDLSQAELSFFALFCVLAQLPA